MAKEFQEKLVGEICSRNGERGGQSTILSVSSQEVRNHSLTMGRRVCLRGIMHVPC
jgi:hypothetical protein